MFHRNDNNPINTGSRDDHWGATLEAEGGPWRPVGTAVLEVHAAVPTASPGEPQDAPVSAESEEDSDERTLLRLGGNGF